jgi:hypothetical protein
MFEGIFDFFQTLAAKNPTYLAKVGGIWPPKAGEKEKFKQTTVASTSGL